VKVAIYARISTTDKDQNPEVQLAPLRAYCTTMGWEIYAEYVDTASAADLTHRTEWTRLMKDASLHKFDSVLVWKIDRAFRSVIHAANSMQQLKNYRVGFRSYMEPAIDTSSPSQAFMFNILSAVSELEREIIRQRVNAGMGHAKEHGTKSGLPIGRKRFDIPFASICKALIKSDWCYSDAARLINREFNRDKNPVSPAFVFSRIKRSGKTKEEIMAEYGDNPQQD
jgi:DNA invertase Pin-like site-specific DNA recombinase